MIALARLMVVGFVVLTILYFLISIYSRSLRREKLEKQWEAEGGKGDRDAYVERGMKEYENSIRPKLILGVYIVPTILVAILLYAVNFM